ncbi:hypothetical protein Aca07nite_31090 [Actinoplanes capillaceus]|uniref:Uncharacterized protein n=1 Tax=Actinoplanes campanulatus TaxID=113559 RepID=A0ABQ3WHV6_9ACTN|nr:hypothetical protein Aca07nite_31090 [Actinoplanes capillaceus]
MQQPEGGVLRGPVHADQPAVPEETIHRGLEDLGETRVHVVGVTVPVEDADADRGGHRHRLEPALGVVQGPYLLDQFGVDRVQVGLGEVLFRAEVDGDRPGGQRGLDRVEQGARVLGAQHHLAHAARLGQRPGLRLQVVGGVEDDRCGGGLPVRVGTEAVDQFQAVDAGHQHVGDDHVGVVGVGEPERVGAVLRLDDLVTPEAEQ